MALGGKEDRDLNLLLEGPGRRVRRRGFLRTAAGLVRDEDGGQPATPAPAAQPLPANRRNERLLNIYNWNDYTDDRTTRCSRR
jgi:hypothetical protein